MKKSSGSKQNALAARFAAQSHHNLHGHHVHHQPIHEHSLASKSESGFKNSRNMKNDFQTLQPIPLELDETKRNGGVAKTTLNS
jgi:hypothetical protein